MFSSSESFKSGLSDLTFRFSIFPVNCSSSLLLSSILFCKLFISTFFVSIPTSVLCKSSLASEIKSSISSNFIFMLSTLLFKELIIFFVSFTLISTFNISSFIFSILFKSCEILSDFDNILLSISSLIFEFFFAISSSFFCTVSMILFISSRIFFIFSEFFIILSPSL